MSASQRSVFPHPPATPFVARPRVRTFPLVIGVWLLLVTLALVLDRLIYP